MRPFGLKPKHTIWDNPNETQNPGSAINVTKQFGGSIMLLLFIRKEMERFVAIRCKTEETKYKNKCR